MDYEIMVPPFKRVPFREMNKTQAEEYFVWYTSQVDFRTSQLINLIGEEGIENELDYSVESLVSIWKWFEGKITFREISEFEYVERLAKYPEWLKPEISKEAISYDTLVIGMDVALYFAKVVLANNATIKWGYFTKPKNIASVNQPVLMGFKYEKELNPRLIIENCIRRSKKEKSENRLLDIYNVWMSFI